MVNGRLVHQTEHLSGLLEVVSPVTAAAEGEAAPNNAAQPAASESQTGLSYPNKTPDVPLERPATGSGCEFDSVEDAIRDIGACVRARVHRPPQRKPGSEGAVALHVRCVILTGFAGRWRGWVWTGERRAQPTASLWWWSTTRTAKTRVT